MKQEQRGLRDKGMIHALGNCPLCNRFSLLFHEVCYRCLQSIEATAIPFEPPFVCPVCHEPLLHSDAICTHSAVTSPVIRPYPNTYTCEHLILRFKRGGIKRLSETLAYLLGPSLAYAGRTFGDMVLAPVPCTIGHERLFGYDHMQEVAKQCTRMYGTPSFMPLSRSGGSPPTDLVRGKGLQAARPTFTCDDKMEIPANRDVIVVMDDIFSSGATMSACIGMLKQQYTIPVIGLCIAVD